MKKIIFLFITAFTCSKADGQDTARHFLKTFDQVLPRFCIDANYMPGSIVSQKISMVDMGNSGYAHIQNAPALNKELPNAHFSKGNEFGSTQGGDIQFAVFLGESRHFGIGTGVMYLYQTGNVALDTFHVEYKSTDMFNNVFRQILTGHGVNEDIKITNISIPIVGKYKHQFTKLFGFTADAGGLINIKTQTGYATHATFDYEAAYANQNGVYSFDATPTADGYNKSDWLITKAQYNTAAHNGGNVTSYFQALNSYGYNVYLNSPVNPTTGNTFYSRVSFGALARLALSYQFSYHVTGNIGAYFVYQDFQNSGNNNYIVTNKVGEYHSVIAGELANRQTTMGASIGFRYFFGEKRDIDGDHVPDDCDSCKLVFGEKLFFGCPDADGDGIPDNIDHCPYQAGPASTHGCPDADGDGIPDDRDSCKFEAGPECTQGCPDRDGDCVADELDACPDQPGPRSNKGCPVGVSPHEDTVRIQPYDANGLLMAPHIVLKSNTIYFSSGGYEVDKSHYGMIDNAIEQLKNNPKVVIYISGYTDNVGEVVQNLMLSIKRAESVYNYLVKNGVSRERIIVSGYGKDKPAVANKTEEDRAKNRRIELKLLLPLDEQ